MIAGMARIEVTIKDTMAFWNDALEAYVYNPDGYAPTNSYVFSVPDDWMDRDSLTTAGLERVYAHLYGETWRSGNGDGSQYTVLDTQVRRLEADDAREATVLGA